MFFFCFRIQSRIQIALPLVSCNLWWFLSLSLSFMTLIICRMSFNLGLSDVFLWLGVWCFPVIRCCIFKIAGRNINNADDTPLMAESEEELKSPLMKVEQESEKAGLKLNIQETKIMASGPITICQIDGETMETVRNFNFGLQNHCRWWLQLWNQRTLAPLKKSYDQPRQHIKKQRHYFANKGPSWSKLWFFQ